MKTVSLKLAKELKANGYPQEPLSAYWYKNKEASYLNGTTEMNYYEGGDDGWGIEDQRKTVKAFISKEFKEYEKRLRRELPDKEDENDRFFY